MLYLLVNQVHHKIIMPSRKNKIITVQILFRSLFANEFIFTNIYLKTEKHISEHAGDSPLFCFGTVHMTVLSTPPRMREYARAL